MVIIGGGFGGLAAARELRHAPVRLTLIDRRNHHLFTPLLYQVATAALNPSDIAVPIRSVLRRQDNATVLLAQVTGIDAPGKRAILSDGEISYDYLILAAGAKASYFGHGDWAAAAPCLSSIEDALEIRKRLLLAYESAERETDPAIQREWLTFVVVGGGPTGVELAGAIAEMAHHSLASDFRRIDPRATRVVMIEADQRVLTTFPPDLSEKCLRSLQRLGVEVRTGSRVTGLDAGGVTLGQERIASRCVLWAAGVGASGIAESLPVSRDRSGRVPVNPDLTLAGHPDLFVVGDLAAVRSGERAVPGVAPAAIQQGRHAARGILRRLRSEPSLAFRYKDRGNLATIGRAAAVADLGRLKLWGFPAWVAWLSVHIFFLIGFRNKLLVMFEWAWAYFTRQRVARLLTGSWGPRLAAGLVLAAPVIAMAATAAVAAMTAMTTMTTLTAMTAMTDMTTMTDIALAATQASSDGQAPPGSEEARLLALVNQERVDRRLAPLRWDETLARLAREHAEDMRRSGTVSHHSSSDGADFTERLARTSLRASASAENVALDRDVQRAHRGLMGSRGHRANILNPGLTAIGIGLARGEGRRVYVVEDFATLMDNLTDAEAAGRVRAALARSRRRFSLAPLEEDARLSRRLVLAARSLSEADSVESDPDVGFASGWTFTYTSFDLDQLPEGVASKLRKARAYALGTAFARTRTYPMGAYWVVLALKSG